MTPTPTDVTGSSNGTALGKGHVEFFPARPHLDIERQSVRGAGVTIAFQAAKFTALIATVSILGRLLTPQDFGLVAMVTAITNLIALFRDMGLASATVQREEITHAQISTLFWLNVTLGTICTGLTCLAAPAIAALYGEPRLKPIAIVIASGFLFAGLAVQHTALLRRGLRFGTVAAIDLSAQIGSAAVGVVAAWHGLGVWALAFMTAANTLLQAIGVWVTCSWRPGRPHRSTGVRSMLKFGGYLTLSSVMNHFARNADNVLVGRTWGSFQLGLYSRAYSLLLMPIGQIVAPITAVAVPVMSRLRADPERYAHFYLKAVSAVAYLTMPLVATLAVLSAEIVRMLLGEKWVAAADIFSILALNALWQPVASTGGWIFVSLDQTRRMAIWDSFASPVMVASFIVGLPWGARGVAASYTICIFALLYPQFWYALRRSPVRIRDFMLAISRPGLLALTVGTSAWVVHLLLRHWALLPRTVFSALAAAVMLLASLCFKVVREDVKSVIVLRKPETRLCESL